MISYHPKHYASKIVQTLKGGSARTWFKEYPETKEQLWGGHLGLGILYVYIRKRIKKYC